MTISDAQRKRAQITLNRILNSPAVRNSKQCQAFLQYAVEKSLSSEDDRLKERDIGVNVFGRESHYDTAEDPIVRNRATEVRKRLSQYYTDSSLPDDLRFEIPSGSYRVEFHWGEEKAQSGAPAVKPPRTRPGWRLAALVSGAVLLLAGVVLFRLWPAPAPLDRFWSPFMASGKPVVVYCGRPVVYFLAGGVYEKHAPKPWDSLAPALDPNAILHGRDIIPVADKFVGVGSAHAALRLNGLFAAKHMPTEVRYANDLSFTDLRGSPSILIGAFSNLWTLQMMKQLRFVFESSETGVRCIRDRSNNRVWQWLNVSPDGTASDDYAIVSRLLDSPTGQPLVCVAGIGTHGTRSAAEFLTDPSHFQEALAGAGANWPKKNLQVVLHTDVYRGIPGRPQVLAVHIW